MHHVHCIFIEVGEMAEVQGLGRKNKQTLLIVTEWNPNANKHHYQGLLDSIMIMYDHSNIQNSRPRLSIEDSAVVTRNNS